MKFAKCNTYMEGIRKLEKESQREPVEVEKGEKRTQRRLEEWRGERGLRKCSHSLPRRGESISKGSSESAKAELRH